MSLKNNDKKTKQQCTVRFAVTFKKSCFKAWMNVFRWKCHPKKDYSRQKQRKIDRFCFLLLLFSSYGKVSTFNGRINHLINIRTLHNNPIFLPQLKKEKGNETKSEWRYVSSGRREDDDDDDAWNLWDLSRPTEHLQTHIFFKVQIDLAYSVTDAAACHRHIPARTMSRRGEAKTTMLGVGVCVGGWDRSRATPSIFGFGSALARRSIFICLWCDENSVSTARPRTQFIRLNSYIH